VDYSALATELLESLSVMVRTATQKEVDEFARGEMFIMNYLVDSGGTALPSELSAAMDASTARVAAALKSLERKGLVVRHLDRTDRRKTRVVITDRGRQAVMDKRRQMHDHMVKVMRELGQDDAKEYLRLIRRIAEISSRISG
jgi:DNA-binding MarR family transcriptional regulator